MKASTTGVAFLLLANLGGSPLMEVGAEEVVPVSEVGVDGYLEEATGQRRLHLGGLVKARGRSPQARGTEVPGTPFFLTRYALGDCSRASASAGCVPTLAKTQCTWLRYETHLNWVSEGVTRWPECPVGEVACLPRRVLRRRSSFPGW